MPKTEKQNFPAKTWIGHGLLIQAVFSFAGGWLGHAYGPLAATAGVLVALYIRAALKHSTYDLIKTRSEGILPKNWLAVVPKKENEKTLAND